MPVSKACWTAVFTLVCFAGTAALAQQASPSTPIRLPPVLEKLELSSQQRKEIEAIISKHDAAFATAWQEFSMCYQRTLKAEAFLLAAIEDGFTDAQRKQAEDQRRKQTLLSLSREAPSPSAANEPGKAAAAPSNETSSSGVALTPEQVAATGKLQEKYHIHLGPMARDIHACHSRLLAIEMEKFLDIEKVLTKEQLKMLTEMLQSGEAAKISGLKSDEAVKN